MTKKEQLEQHKERFLQIRDYFTRTGEGFALAKAYKKPWKWYGLQPVQESIEILRAEAKAI